MLFYTEQNTVKRGGKERVIQHMVFRRVPSVCLPERSTLIDVIAMRLQTKIWMQIQILCGCSQTLQVVLKGTKITELEKKKKSEVSNLEWLSPDYQWGKRMTFTYYPNNKIHRRLCPSSGPASSTKCSTTTLHSVCIGLSQITDFPDFGSHLQMLFPRTNMS